MNVAFPALIVFLVLLPGFIARSRFKLAERVSLDYAPFGQIATEAVLWSVLAHAAALFISGLVFSRELKPEILLKLMSTDPSSQAAAANAISAEWKWICGYFVSIFVAAHILPSIARDAITRMRCDRIGHPLSRWLRFYGAPWYYLLTGADFEAKKEPDLIAISALVNVAGTPILYVGILADFFLDQDGRLDRLVLQQVIRRPLKADKLQPTHSSNINEPAKEDKWSRFYPVDGDSFVLRYSETITLNIEYIKLQHDTVRLHLNPPAVASG